MSDEAKLGMSSAIGISRAGDRGHVAAEMTPAPVRPIAQQVLPPIGGQAGAWVGRQVDNVTQHLPRLW